MSVYFKKDIHVKCSSVAFMFVFLLLSNILIKTSYWTENIFLLLIGFCLFLLPPQMDRFSYMDSKRSRMESVSD